MLSLTTAAPRSWGRFYCRGNTLLLFFHSTLKQMSYPNNISKRCAPAEEIHKSFCSQEVPSRWWSVPGPGQTSPLHQAAGGTVSVWPVKYSFNWATALHQNLVHLYMTCMPESLWEALQINLAAYKQTSQVHNDWAKQLVIPHCSEFHRSPNKPKTPNAGIQILSCGKHIPIHSS